MVYWESEDEWFHGVIDDYHPEQGYHIQYYDGDDEWLHNVDDPALVQFEDAKQSVDNSFGDTAGLRQSQDDDEIVVASTQQVRQLSKERELFEAEMAAGRLGDDNETLSVEAFDNKHSHFGGEDSKSLLRDFEPHAPSREYNVPEDDLGTEESFGLSPLRQLKPSIQTPELYEDANAEVADVEERDMASLIEGDEAYALLPARGIRLVGSLQGASHIPPAPEDELDGRVFFKVLFVEGGSQNSMFRCKTPIFTSQPAADAMFPSWDHSTFRFEMILPEPKEETNADALTSLGSAAGVKDRRIPPAVRAKQAANPPVIRSKFEVKGEILIAMYRIREKGGAEFIGQSVFDLAEMAQAGTTALPKHPSMGGVQMRNLAGSFPVISRSGRVAGDGLCHIDVHLELSWKPDPRDVQNPSAPTRKVEANTVENAISEEPVRTDATAPVRAKSPHKGKERGLNGLVKQMTYNAKKNILEQHRINKENKLLAHRIKAHHIKGVNKHASVKPAEEVYLVPPTDKYKPSTPAEEAQQLYARKAQKMSHAELMNLYNDLKKDVATRQQSVTDLQARLNRLHAHTDKYERANEKLRKRVDAEAKCAAGSRARVYEVRAAPAESKSGEPSDPERHAEVRAQSKGVTLTTANIYLQEVHSKEGDSESKNPTVAALAPAATHADESIKNHLREVKIEYNALQEVRRILVNRMARARKAVVTNTSSLLDAQQRETMARQRLGSAFSNLGNKFAGGSSNNLLNKNKSPEERAKEISMDNDLQAIERVRGVQLELARIEATYNAGLHLGALQDSYTELQGTERILKRLLSEVNQEVDDLKARREVEERSVSGLSQEGLVIRLRELEAFQRDRLLQLARSKRLQAADNNADEIELESLRLTLRRQQIQAENM